MQFASDDLKADPDFILAALELGCSLVHASPALRRDKDIVLKAVEFNIEGLMFASEKLQGDKCVPGSAASTGDSVADGSCTGKWSSRLWSRIGGQSSTRTPSSCGTEFPSLFRP